MDVDHEACKKEHEKVVANLKRQHEELIVDKDE